MGGRMFPLSVALESWADVGKGGESVLWVEGG